MANRADTFNRADSSSSLGIPSDAGSAWLPLQGTWGILSNQGGLIVSAGDDQDIAVLECSSSVVRVQVTLDFGSCDVGLVARVVDSTNYLLLHVHSTLGFNLYKRVGGTFTQLGTTDPTTPVNGDVIEMRVSAGNAITCYLNGVHLPNLDATDSAGSTATQHGIRSAGYLAATVSFNDFSITDDGSVSPAAGTAVFVSSGTPGIVVTSSDATGGTAPYTYQWRRNTDGGSYSDLTNGGGISGATTLTVTDDSAVVGHLYGYKLNQTDATPTTVTTNTITAEVYAGGSLSGGGITAARLFTGF